MCRRTHPHAFLDKRAQLHSVGAQLFERARVFTQQLRLFLERVLSRLEATDDHRVDDPCDLDVGQLPVERLVVDVAEKANSGTAAAMGAV